MDLLRWRRRPRSRCPCPRRLLITHVPPPPVGRRLEAPTASRAPVTSRSPVPASFNKAPSVTPPSHLCHRPSQSVALIAPSGCETSWAIGDWRCLKSRYHRFHIFTYY